MSDRYKARCQTLQVELGQAEEERDRSVRRCEELTGYIHRLESQAGKGQQKHGVVQTSVSSRLMSAVLLDCQCVVLCEGKLQAMLGTDKSLQVSVDTVSIVWQSVAL